MIFFVRKKGIGNVKPIIKYLKNIDLCLVMRSMSSNRITNISTALPESRSWSGPSISICLRKGRTLLSPFSDKIKIIVGNERIINTIWIKLRGQIGNWISNLLGLTISLSQGCFMRAVLRNSG